MAARADAHRTHAAVVAVRVKDDPQAIAQAAASASLDLLRKVTVPHDYKLAIESVTIVEPVGTDDARDMLMAALRGHTTSRQAVVVTAKLHADVAAATPAGGEAS